MDSDADSQIVVLDATLPQPVWRALFSLGRERGWTLLDLRYTGNAVPKGVRPHGAFVTKLPDTSFVTELLKTGCHVVRLGNAPHPMDNIVPAVFPDLQMAGRLAAEHFAERGFRHLGFIHHDDRGIYWHLLKGFRSRGEELDCECNELEWHLTGQRDHKNPKEYVYRQRLRAFKRWLSGLPKPIGLLAVTDDRAALHNRMCRDAGFGVPTEVAILAVGNNHELCETVYPSLSSVILDDAAVARQGLDLLKKMSQGKRIANPTISIPPKGIIARRSTEIIAAEAPEVARAIAFMMEYFTEAISINDITHAAGVCRAKLFTAFDGELGKPPGTVLTGIRIDRAKRMLRGTDQKVPMIAEACGFGASINMYHHFKKSVGISPDAYRRSKEE